ncbi:magnesium transporter NIPA [Toxoplasma gondii MAS]|uniref:Magnesium transporter NIPA n=4 Tax=Toxoplasma gondii TaxID=5811 RepID=B9QDV2_TOXGV|nr:magnesium transporter NIPA [Toxoplasma gondii VEG]KFG28857.1 magnesium transporter NIPA [Toxoplasma gondii p89]KFH12085.1 magnesium transporter NIPA [Toxoplasma gondii MAS]PUA90087.1 magnesium transporter NIPA [Toxoplasma gondii TgCATBr9]CEL75883.1 TPA: Magnesium transporter NIPA3 [Toxoplasma gondii VEG]
MADIPGGSLRAASAAVSSESVSALAVDTDTDLSALWPVGVCVIIVGSFAGAAGDILIRRSFLRMGGCLRLGSVVKNPGWVWGMLLTAVLDPISTFVALLFAPATIVAPFAGMHIFWGCVLAVVCLKERMRVWDVAGAALIILGITLIVIFSGKEQVISSVSDFATYLPLPGAIAYMCVTSAVSVVASLLSADRVIARLFPPSQHPGRGMVVQRIALSSASGIVGGATNIGAKALVIALAGFLAHPRETLASWSTYLIVFIAAFLGLFQLYYLNMALRKYEASYVVPMINSFLIASGSVGGILILQEHPDNWAAFFCGLSLVVCGVFVLSGSKAAGPGGSSGASGPRMQASIAAGELVRLASFVSFGDNGADAYEPKRSRRHSLQLGSRDFSTPKGEERVGGGLRAVGELGKTSPRSEREEEAAERRSRSRHSEALEETLGKSECSRERAAVDGRRSCLASRGKGGVDGGDRAEEDLEAAVSHDDEAAELPPTRYREQPLVRGAAAASQEEEELKGMSGSDVQNARKNGNASRTGDTHVGQEGLRLREEARPKSPVGRHTRGEVPPFVRALSATGESCGCESDAGRFEGRAPTPEVCRQLSERRGRTEKNASDRGATSPRRVSKLSSSNKFLRHASPERSRGKGRGVDEVRGDKRQANGVERLRLSSSAKDLTGGRRHMSRERSVSRDRLPRHNNPVKAAACHWRSASPGNLPGVRTPDFAGDWTPDAARSRECHSEFRSGDTPRNQRKSAF